MAGQLGVAVRNDGTRQVTYNGYPLYFFIKDSKSGDTNGQGVKDVWFVVHPNDSLAAAPTQLPVTGGESQPLPSNSLLLIVAGIVILGLGGLTFARRSR